MRRLQIGFWRKLNAFCILFGISAKMLFVLVTLAVATSMQSVVAQNGSPFDLAPRLDSTKVSIPTAQLPPNRIPEPVKVPAKRNPFDLARTDQDTLGKESKVKSVLRLPTFPSTTTAGEVRMTRGTFDTILCFSLLVLLALTTVLQGGPLRRMINASMNSNMLSQLQRESRKFGYFLWCALGLILIGIFLFVTARHLYPDLINNSWTTLGWFILVVMGLTALKLLVLNILKLIFPLAKPVETYQTLILVFAGVIGLCLFPALILVCFGAPGLATGVIYVGLGLIAIGFLIRSLRALGNSVRYISGYPFHFLLYLCGLEIGPLAVAIKLLTA